MSDNLTQFNSTLKEFLTNLINIFPNTQTEILNHYRPLLENGEYDSNEYCKDFMQRVQDYKHDIINKNESMFHHSICLFPGIDFELIWNSDFNTPKTKKSIWIYLNVFWSLGNRVIAEQKKKQEQINDMTDEEKCFANLKEATTEIQKEKQSSKEIFLRNLTDKDLMNELERRKAEKANKKAEDDDEEDLLNFDPNQGYSLWNSIKAMTGGMGSNNILGGLGNIEDIIKMIKNTLGFDLSSLDLENFDISNIGNMIRDLMTPDNLEKVKETIMKFASDFQSDIDSGDIDKSELSNIFNMVKENITKMASGEIKEEENENMMEKMMSSAQKMFGNMIPPHMRGQFEKMQREVLKDPSNLVKMMGNPEAMMEQMMGNNKAMLNRFNNANRVNKTKERLLKKIEDKQRIQDNSNNEINITQADSTNKKKRKNKKKKNSGLLETDNLPELDLSELDLSNLHEE